MRRLALLAALLVGAGVSSGYTTTYQAHDDTAWFVADTCRLTMPLEVVEPASASSAPVFLWIHGTGAEAYEQVTAKAAAAAAADAGFVAAWPAYRGRWSVGNDHGTDLQAACIFNRSRPSRSALDAVCERPPADCTRIVVGGHSQGGMIALRAANHAGGIKAVHPTGVFASGSSSAYWASYERGGGRVLPDAAVRIAVGLADLNAWWVPGHRAGDYTGLRTFTGLTCANGAGACTRADGSGWHVVQHAPPPAGPTDGYADHCYMNVGGCPAATPWPADPYWTAGEAPWTLRRALEWLRARAG